MQPSLAPPKSGSMNVKTMILAMKTARREGGLGVSFDNGEEGSSRSNELPLIDAKPQSSGLIGQLTREGEPEASPGVRRGQLQVDREGQKIFSSGPEVETQTNLKP